MAASKIPRSKSWVVVVGQASHLRKAQACWFGPSVKLIPSSPGTKSWKVFPSPENVPDQWRSASLPAETTQRMPASRPACTIPSGVLGPPLPSPRAVL